MPGFFISDKKIDIELINRYPERCLKNEIKYQDYTIKRNTLNKFMMDKAFFQDNRYVVILDGYLLNKKDLLFEYNCDEVSRLLIIMYEAEGEVFFNRFRGGFVGALYDKDEDIWLIFTNQMGDKAVYYTCLDDGFACGTQFNYICDARKKRLGQCTFDENAAYHMLTFAFMEEDETFVREIKRLRGGEYLRVYKKKVEVKKYYWIEKHPELITDWTEDRILEELNDRFVKAVKMEYDKDDEYGLEHLCDLSGGLDSRMNVWVAHTTGDRHLNCITYCKSDYLDEKIAKQIAAFWGDELIVKPLDDLSWAYDIDELTFMNAGLSLYLGITGGKKILESHNMDRFGLEHTGQLGDVIIGSYLRTVEDLCKPSVTGKYSEKIKITDSSDKYEDREIYLLNTRGFRGVLNTHQIRDNYTEVASPFLDLNLFQFCMDIPIEMRIGHHLYKKWIINYYPKAADFIWEKTGHKITTSELQIKIKSKEKRVYDKFYRIITKEKYSSDGMNPLDYWYNNDKSIRNFMHGYFDKYITKAKSVLSENLVTDMIELFQTGNTVEKTMVLTVLAILKLIL